MSESAAIPPCRCKSATQTFQRAMQTVCRSCGGARPASTSAPTRGLSQSQVDPRVLAVWPGERIR